MPQPITPLTASLRHKKLILSYTKTIRSIIKDYFLKSWTTKCDVIICRNEALALINDMKLVLQTTRNLSEANSDCIRENIQLLQTFERSLVATRNELCDSDTQSSSGSIKYAIGS